MGDEIFCLAFLKNSPWLLPNIVSRKKWKYSQEALRVYQTRDDSPSLQLVKVDLEAELHDEQMGKKRGGQCVQISV